MARTDEQAGAGFHGLDFFAPPRHESFRARLMGVRAEKAELMERLMQLNSQEMSLERILDEPPTG